MNAISFDQIKKKIESGHIDSLYYLSGAEKFFHDHIIEQLIQKIFSDPGNRDLNYNMLYGTENSEGELISAASSYPMLAMKKLVIVRDFDKMKITDFNQFERFLGNLPQTTCLVLSATEKGKSKIDQLMSKYAQNVNCSSLSEYKIAGWYSNYCKQRGLLIDAEALNFLIDRVGYDLLALEQELKKVLNFKNDDSAITVADLEQTSGMTREFTVFALQDELSRRQLGNSLKICKQLQDSGDNINYIIAILFAHFRKLILIASLKEKGKSNTEIARTLQVNEYYLKKTMENLRHFRSLQIKKVIQYLHEADLASKTSALSDQANLQMLCYKICRI